MKQKLIQRLKDNLPFKKDPLAEIKNFFAAFSGPQRILKRLEKQWREIDYVLQELKYDFNKESDWWVYFNGISIPRYNNAGVNVTISHEVFYPFLRTLGIGENSPEPCYFKNERRKVIPCLPVTDLFDGDYQAKKIIDGYLEHRESIQKALEEIDRVYPTSFQEARQLAPRFKELGLDFVRVR